MEQWQGQDDRGARVGDAIFEEGALLRIRVFRCWGGGQERDISCDTGCDPATGWMQTGPLEGMCPGHSWPSGRTKTLLLFSGSEFIGSFRGPFYNFNCMTGSALEVVLAFSFLFGWAWVPSCPALKVLLFLVEIPLLGSSTSIDEKKMYFCNLANYLSIIGKHDTVKQSHKIVAASDQTSHQMFAFIDPWCDNKMLSV